MDYSIYDFPKQLDQFTAYAKKVIMNHTEEIDTEYETGPQKLEAEDGVYKLHQKMVDKQLSIKIDELTNDNSNAMVRTSLIYLKEYYLSTFKNDIDHKH